MSKLALNCYSNIAFLETRLLEISTIEIHYLQGENFHKKETETYEVPGKFMWMEWPCRFHCGVNEAQPQHSQGAGAFVLMHVCQMVYFKLVSLAYQNFYFYFSCFLVCEYVCMWRCVLHLLMFWWIIHRAFLSRNLSNKQGHFSY